MPAASGKQGERIDAKALQALPQHFAPLAEGRLRHRGEQIAPRRRGRRARHELDDGRGHLRRRREGRGRNVEQNPRLAAPVAEHGEPAVIGALAGVATIRSATSLLEHQHEAGRTRAARPALPASGSAARSRCYKADWRRSAPGRAAADQRGKIDRERVARDDLEPAGIMRGDFGQRRQAALIALDGDDACARLPRAARASVRRARGRSRRSSRPRADRRRGRYGR